MEIISMIFAITFLTIFVIGSLIHSYYYEIRNAFYEIFENILRFFKMGKRVN